MRWFRPILDEQHYSKGWPDGVIGEMGGSKYETDPDFSVVLGLSAADADGNADLTFTNGKLLTPFPVKTVAINDVDSVTRITDPASFTLVINRATGRISGTFTHNLDNSVTAYQGIVLQTTGASGAAGFFLTKTPTVKDYTGEGGAVSLVPH